MVRDVRENEGVKLVVPERPPQGFLVCSLSSNVQYVAVSDDDKTSTEVSSGFP